MNSCRRASSEDIISSPSFPRERRSKTSSSSGRGAGTMTIDVQLADAGKKCRPLPRIPINIPPVPKSAPPAPPRWPPRSLKLSCPSPPKSAPPVPPQHFPRPPSPRPLPSPPGSVTAFPVSPTTPSSPPTSAFQSRPRLSPAHALPRPPGFGPPSLTLQTSFDMLKPRVFETRENSPGTPTFPEPPTPRTAQRKRLNKLRRHLGESVVQVVSDRPGEVDVLIGLRRAGKPVTVNMTVETDSHSDGSSSRDSDGSSSPDSDSCSDSGTDDRVDYFFPSYKAPSQKWMRERGKARWTEDDFTKVLNDLRAL
ncbi:hypothetical protein K438DRAFT_1968256 [Mycena galopus ATCC 62051]|nr:hypothetical protein K438DRAFT_1968256 [Mycena galopus ATCC 62051]